MKTFEIQSKGPEETERLGRALGSVLGPGSVICLRGGLGAGKTVLVRGLARAFLDSDDLLVTSPTYVLQHVYQHQDRFVYHIDAYRIKGGEQELEDSGLREYLTPEKGVTCLEWPEQIASAIPGGCVEIQIEHEGDDDRTIRVTASSAFVASISKNLEPSH